MGEEVNHYSFFSYISTPFRFFAIPEGALPWKESLIGPAHPCHYDITTIPSSFLLAHWSILSSSDGTLIPEFGMEHSKKKKNDRVLPLQCKYIKVHSGQGALHNPGPQGHVLFRGKCGFSQTKKLPPSLCWARPTPGPMRDRILPGWPRCVF